MGIILSDISALSYYRTDIFDDPASPARKPLRRQQAERALSTTQPLKSVALIEQDAHVQHPIHVLIPNESARTRSKKLICHIESAKLPTQAFLPINENVLVVSPALLLETMATTLPLPQLVSLGWELCGDYRLSLKQARSFQTRPALGQPEGFSTMLLERQHSRGTNSSLALDALNFTSSHSASPMETIVGIQLSLPCRYGGFGLPKPQMNHRIGLNSTAKKTSRKSFLIADLFWPEHNLCVEYQSTQFHTGAERIDSDARRRTALEDLGITVVEVTAQQAFDPEAMGNIAHILARKMGKRIRPHPSWEDKHAKMRSSLLCWHRIEV